MRKYSRHLPNKKPEPVVKIEVPGVSGEITKEGVDSDVGKPKN
jgi:hypothetical protein